MIRSSRSLTVKRISKNYTVSATWYTYQVIPLSCEAIAVMLWVWSDYYSSIQFYIQR